MNIIWSLGSIIELLNSIRSLCTVSLINIIIFCGRSDTELSKSFYHLKYVNHFFFLKLHLFIVSLAS